MSASPSASARLSDLLTRLGTTRRRSRPSPVRILAGRWRGRPYPSPGLAAITAQAAGVWERIRGNAHVAAVRRRSSGCFRCLRWPRCRVPAQTNRWLALDARQPECRRDRQWQRRHDGSGVQPGRHQLAFVSRASDLVAGDGEPPDFTDIYVKDLDDGAVTLVSRSATGAGGGNEDSSDPIFSPDGTKVAFVSSADDLGPQDTDRFGPDPEGERDVYVHDLNSRATALVSQAATGGDSGNWGVVRPDIRPGRQQPGLLHQPGRQPRPTRLERRVHRHLRARHRRRRSSLVTIDSLGVAAANGRSSNPVLSADGNTIAFERGDEPGRRTHALQRGNIYVRDLDVGVTSLVSEHPSGRGLINASAESPAISPDGRLVAFTTHAYDLGPTDDDLDSDVYLRDLEVGETHLVSTNATYHASLPVFSLDGSMIAYMSGLAHVRPRSDGSIDLVNSADTDVPVPSMEPCSRSALMRQVRQWEASCRVTAERLRPLCVRPRQRRCWSGLGQRHTGLRRRTITRRYRTPCRQPGRSVDRLQQPGVEPRQPGHQQPDGRQIFTVEVFIASCAEFDTTDVAMTYKRRNGIGIYGVATFRDPGVQ